MFTDDGSVNDGARNVRHQAEEGRTETDGERFVLRFDAPEARDDAVDSTGGVEKFEYGRSDDVKQKHVVTVGWAVTARHGVDRWLLGRQLVGDVRPRTHAAAVGVNLDQQQFDSGPHRQQVEQQG